MSIKILLLKHLQHLLAVPPIQKMVIYGLDRSLDYTFEIQAIFPGETVGDSISTTVTASKSTQICFA